jgi:hypothetical protein
MNVSPQAYLDHSQGRRKICFRSRLCRPARQAAYRNLQDGARGKEAGNRHRRGREAEGTHTAHSDSITVAQAGANWLANGRATPLERSTLVEYEQVLTLHILPYLGTIKLSKLTAPDIVAFRNRLSGERSPSGRKRSPRLIKHVIGCLGSSSVKNRRRIRSSRSGSGPR